MSRYIFSSNVLNFMEAVCCIETPIGHGSGFHWGSGWVMTNSHVLCGKNILEPNVDMRQIEFNFSKTSKRFTGQDRFAIVVELGDGVPDLALIKLGYQVSYGRNKFLEWEEDEEQLRSGLPSLCNAVGQQVTQGQSVFVIHYGDTSEQKISYCGVVQKIYEKEFKHTSYTRRGSSGSPVFDANYPHNVLGVSRKGDLSDDSVNYAVLLDALGKNNKPVRELMRQAMIMVEREIAYKSCAKESGGSLSEELFVQASTQASNRLKYEHDSGIVCLPPLFFSEERN